MTSKGEIVFRLRELADAIENCGDDGDNFVIALAIGGNGKLASLRYEGERSTPDTHIAVVGMCSILHTSLIDDYFALRASADTPDDAPRG